MNETNLKIYSDYIENHFTNRITPGDDSFLNPWKYALSHCNTPEQIINEFLTPDLPVSFEQPDALSIELYDSFAGLIPVISTTTVNDFENLVTNVVHKGVRPDNISKTGASFIFGKTTRFIILSNKPYSNVPASELGLTDDEWKQKSLILRREHECTHFYTKKNFGIAKNHLHDELMADFFGLYEAFGSYSSEYFLHFMGIKGTTGTRLSVYIPDCDTELFEKLKETATLCAQGLERWSKTDGFAKKSRRERIDFLCGLGIKGILCL